jgi:hypothetical protein
MPKLLPTSPQLTGHHEPRVPHQRIKKYKVCHLFTTNIPFRV